MNVTCECVPSRGLTRAALRPAVLFDPKLHTRGNSTAPRPGENFNVLLPAGERRKPEGMWTRLKAKGTALRQAGDGQVKHWTDFTTRVKPPAKPSLPGALTEAAMAARTPRPPKQTSPCSLPPSLPPTTCCSPGRILGTGRTPPVPSPHGCGPPLQL